jgi:ABC-type Zn2+ transport system substrate-binding protein/surface adhesin
MFFESRQSYFEVASLARQHKYSLTHAHSHTNTHTHTHIHTHTNRAHKNRHIHSTAHTDAHTHLSSRYCPVSCLQRCMMGTGHELEPETVRRKPAAAAAARAWRSGGMASKVARSLAYMVGTPMKTVMPPSCARGIDEAHCYYLRHN